MGKYKDYIYSNAETQVNNISDDYAKCNITLDVAVDKIKKVDNYEMVIDEATLRLFSVLGESTSVNSSIECQPASPSKPRPNFDPLNLQNN